MTDEVQVTARVDIPVYVTCDGDALAEALVSLADAVERLRNRYATTDGGDTQVLFGDAPTRITLDNLPSQWGDDGSNGIRIFPAVLRLREFAVEVGEAQWQADAEKQIEPAIKALRGAMPGETIAAALRALADRYETL